MKKGIELQVSFLVVLILAIAALALGLAFAANLFNKATELQKNLDTQTELEIRKALDSGQALAIPINRKEIPRNKFDKFGVGIFNTLTADTTDFEIEIKFSEFFWKTTNEPAGCDSNKAPTISAVIGDCEESFYPVDEIIQVLGDYDPGMHTAIITVDSMKPNDKEYKIIGVDIVSEAASGTYVYDVKAYTTNPDTGEKELYGKKQKFYVKVP